MRLQNWKSIRLNASSPSARVIWMYRLRRLKMGPSVEPDVRAQ
jgi:hypothetical protein